MARAIEEWLQKRVGFSINMESTDIGRKLYDGCIYYSILKSHNLISNDCAVEPKRNCSSKEALININRLCPWFRLIGITHTNTFMEQIAYKSNSNALRLLFELYFKLQDSFVIDLIVKQLEEKKKDSPSVQLEEFKELPVIREIRRHPSELVAFSLNRELTMKYSELRKMIIATCSKETRARREMYKQSTVKNLSETKIDQRQYLRYMPKFKGKYLKTLEDVKGFAARYESENPLDQNYVSCDPQQYIHEFKNKTRVNLGNELMKLKMQNMFLRDIWAALFKKKGEEFEKYFMIKLNQQSEYERKLAIRLAQLHNNNLEFFDRKHQQSRHNEGDLTEESILINDILRKRAKRLNMNWKSLQEDHKKIYENKKRLRHERHVDECRDIAIDIVDLAVIVAEYKKTNGICPNRRVMNDWKELFYRCIPYFPNRERKLSTEGESEDEWDWDEESHETDDMAYEDIRTIDSQILLDRVIMETLNNFYVHSYLYLVGQWMIEDWPDLGSGKENLDIHGYVIHRMLETKYPFPPPPKPANIDHFEIRAIIKYFYDPMFHYCLQELVRDSGVILIKLNEAMHYCIDRYEEENGVITFGRKETREGFKKMLRKNSSKKSIRRQSSGSRRKSTTKKKKDSNGEVDSKKESNSRRQSSSKKVSAKRGSVKKGDGKKRLSMSKSTSDSQQGLNKSPEEKAKKKLREPAKTINDKAVQYPSIEDFYRRVNLTEAGKLGKLAQEAIRNGTHLDDVLSAKVIVEYLKSLTNYRGFVLVDFPNTVGQATLLEFLITGKPIQLNLKVEDSAKDYIHNALHPPFKLDIQKILNFEGVVSKFIKETALEVIPTKHDEREVEKRLLEETLRRKLELAAEAELEEEEAIVEEEVVEEAAPEEIIVSEQEPEPPKPVAPAKPKKSISRRASSKKRQSTAKKLPKNDTKDTKHATNKSDSVTLQESGYDESRMSERDVLKEIVIERSAPIEKKKEDVKEPEWKLKYKEPVVVPDPNIITVTLEELAKYRMSKILPRPNVGILLHPVHKTFVNKCLVNFTETKLPKDKTSKKSYASLQRGSKLFSESCDIGANAYEKLAAPLNFYQYFNALYSCVHTPDFIPISKIARLILNETDDKDDPVRKESQDLFGPSALELSSKYKPKSISRTDAKIGGKVKVESKASEQKKSISRKSVAQKHKTITSEPPNKTKQLKGRVSKTESFNVEEEIEQEDVIAKARKSMFICEHTPPPVISFPGDPGWEYAKEEIPLDVEVALASRWEVIEATYLSGLYQVMQLLRVHTAKFFPYRNFVRNVLEEAIKFTDDRTRIVYEFQNLFNDVDSDMRKDPEMKMELQCRVYELWNLLCEMSDAKKQSAENVMTKIMERGWILSFCCTLINIFLSLMQLEIDRSVDTIQLLNDYYLNMLRASINDPPLEKILLERVVIPEEEELFSMMLTERPATKLQMQNLLENTIKQMNDAIFKTDTVDMEILTSLVIMPMQQAAKKAYQCKSRTRMYVNNVNVGRELLVTLPSKSKTVGTKGRKADQTSRNRVFSMYLPVKNSPIARQNFSIHRMVEARSNKIDTKCKKVKKPEIDDGNEGVYYEQMDIDDMDKIDKIKWEWFTAIRNECDRMNFRFKLIEAKMKVDLQEIVELSQQMFSQFEKDIAVIFHREVGAIEQLCKVLQTAILEETDIPPRLVLEGDRFYMEVFENIFDDNPPPPPSPVEMVSSEYSFNTTQLENIITKLSYVSPNGVLEGPFVPILEDMVVFTTKDNCPYLPPKWGLLDSQDIRFIVEHIFGEMDVYDWRDFVIFNLNIPLPTAEELLFLKERYKVLDVEGYENISYQQFMSVPLWFESMLSDRKEIGNKKKILFRLFQVSFTEFNYSSFIFAFCRGEDGLEGFMKALTLVDDRGILINAEAYKEEVEAREDAQRIADQIIIQVLHEVIIRTEGVKVTTLPRNYIDAYEELFVEETVGEELMGEEELEEEEIVEEEEEEATDDTVTIAVHPKPAPKPTYPERYNHPKWQVCIPYKLVVSLFILALNFYFLPPSHQWRQLEIEQALQELYEKKGKNGYIKGYILAESDIIKNIFQTTNVFRWFNMSYYVEKFIENKLIAKEQERKNIFCS